MLDTKPTSTNEPQPPPVPTRTRPLALTSGLLAVVSVGAFFGEWWWLLDIASNFRFQLAITALGLVIGAVALRGRLATVLAAVALVANAAPIVPLYLGPAGADAEPEIRVASYNLLASAGQSRGEVMEWIMDVDADVIFLHEATVRWARFFERTEVPYEMHGPYVSPGNPFGTMALVRTGVAVERVDITSRPSPVATVSVDGEAVQVLGVHALSPYSRERSSIRDGELRALGEWARSEWPADANSVIDEAAGREPNADVLERLQGLLEAD